jgi:hypothetical protein
MLRPFSTKTWPVLAFAEAKRLFPLLAYNTLTASMFKTEFLSENVPK